MRKPLVVAILGALMLTGLAHGAAHASPAATQRTIRFRVLNATTQQLTVSRESTNGVGEWRETPAKADHLRVADFSERTSDQSLSGWVVYRLESSGYYARVVASNPLIGGKSTDCRIENAAGTVMPNAPYACRWTHGGSGSDMNAYFVVEPKAAATHVIDVRDAAARAAALDAICGTEGMQYESCGVREVEDVSSSTTPTQALGNIAVNCAPAGHTFAASIKTDETNTTSNSVGGSNETKLAVATALKVVLKAYYRHTWTDTTTDSKAYTVDVPSGYYGWMERSMTMQDVRADYVVTAGNQTYEIPSVTVSAPAAGNAAGGVAVARTVPIPASSDVCNNRDAGGLLPMPAAPRVGKSYSIGIATANQRVITAGTSPLRVTRYEAGTTGQQWEFTELPGHEGQFQVRSVATPATCLANDTAADTLTTGDCKAAGASDVATQLWSVELDPATSSFKLVSAQNARQPEAASTAVDAPIAMSAAPSTSLGRWEFRITG